MSTYERSRTVDGGLGQRDRVAALDASMVAAGYGSMRVVHEASISVPTGSIMAIVGRNGVGKSTLVNALMGLLPLQSGRITFKGTDITQWSTVRRVKAGIGIVPQGRRIFPDLTVLENLQVGFRCTGRWSIDAVFSLFPRLAERARIHGGLLSGGEQQMLAIGRALVRNPQLILLDEPSEGLAPKVVDVVLEALNRLKSEGLTLLLVEQKLDAALAVADAVAVLDMGKVVASHEVSADTNRASLMDQISEEMGFTRTNHVSEGYRYE